MIEFPESTKVNKKIPKEAFYKHLSLSNELKAKFVSDIDRITIENSLTKENLNLTDQSEISEILLLSISLKKKDIDKRIIEAIARQNPHQLIFLLKFQNQKQLAVYHHRLYRSKWSNDLNIKLTSSGTNLSLIWDDLIRQVALGDNLATDNAQNSTNEKLKIQDRINTLTKSINKTERAVWKEKQPKKRFELYQKLQSYKKELKEITGGKA